MYIYIYTCIYIYPCIYMYIYTYMYAFQIYIHAFLFLMKILI